MRKTNEDLTAEFSKYENDNKILKKKIQEHDGVLNDIEEVNKYEKRELQEENNKLRTKVRNMDTTLNNKNIEIQNLS